MSLTFTLQGYESVLSENYYPPVELNPNYDYCIGLIGFHTYNTIRNIEDGINNECVVLIPSEQPDEKEIKIIKIPSGAYEISDINKYLRSQLGDDAIFIKPNNNTIKCEIKCKYDIDFTSARTIGKLLGFSNRVLIADILHESDIPVQIVKVNTVRLECNIVTGAFYDNKLSHTLYEFSPTVDPGYSIDIKPSNILYLKVNTYSIDNITISILDQSGDIVDFHGEKIIVRLELKKIN